MRRAPSGTHMRSIGAATDAPRVPGKIKAKLSLELCRARLDAVPAQIVVAPAETEHDEVAVVLDPKRQPLIFECIAEFREIGGNRGLVATQVDDKDSVRGQVAACFTVEVEGIE